MFYRVLIKIAYRKKAIKCNWISSKPILRNWYRTGYRKALDNIFTILLFAKHSFGLINFKGISYVVSNILFCCYISLITFIVNLICDWERKLHKYVIIIYNCNKTDRNIFVVFNFAATRRNLKYTERLMYEKYDQTLL